MGKPRCECRGSRQKGRLGTTVATPATPPTDRTRRRAFAGMSPADRPSRTWHLPIAGEPFNSGACNGQGQAATRFDTHARSRYAPAPSCGAMRWHESGGEGSPADRVDGGNGFGPATERVDRRPIGRDPRGAEDRAGASWAAGPRGQPRPAKLRWRGNLGLVLDRRVARAGFPKHPSGRVRNRGCRPRRPCRRRRRPNRSRHRRGRTPRSRIGPWPRRGA